MISVTVVLANLTFEENRHGGLLNQHNLWSCVALGPSTTFLPGHRRNTVEQTWKHLSLKNLGFLPVALRL
jgi:hypothetical protein